MNCRVSYFSDKTLTIHTINNYFNIMGIIIIQFVHKGMKMQCENAHTNELKNMKPLQRHGFRVFLYVLLNAYLNEHCMLNVSYAFIKS